MSYPSKDWINKSNYKVKQILEEVGESMPITLPIQIEKLVELYVPDTQIRITRDPDITTVISACATRDMRNGWFILLNEYEPRKRQRFSIAHELGHMTLMPNPASTVYCGKGNDWEEKLCDSFAGKLLVPDSFLLKYFENSPNPYLEDVADAFQVSPQVAYIRIRDMGLPYAKRFDYEFLPK